VVVEFTRGMV